MTPDVEELDQLKKQNAMLLRALVRVKAERDDLAKKLAAIETPDLSPRAQQGRPNGWSSSSVRSVLERPLYRGEVVYGKTACAYGRELGKQSAREHGQIPKPEETWTKLNVAELRIITPELAARVDARREHWRRRVVAAKTKGRAPQNAGGKYLLSGGLLVCPTCGGHFEAFKSPWAAIYVCATRRRKPGICTNALALPIAETDDTVLDMVEGEALGGKFIDELLALVDTTPDTTTAAAAERVRLMQAITTLVESVAKGMPADSIAPVVKQYQAEVAKLDVLLRSPKPAPPNREKLREALQQRATEWRATLRDEPSSHGGCCVGSSDRLRCGMRQSQKPRGSTGKQNSRPRCLKGSHLH